MTIAAFAVLCISAVTHSIPPAPEEPLPLRWMRVAADHPWRVGLAVALATFALKPRRDPSGATPR